MQEKLLLSRDEKQLQIRVAQAEEENARLIKENNSLKKRVICRRKEQDALQLRGKVRLQELLGLAVTDNFKLHKRRAFSLLWSDYRNRFGVRSYRDTLEINYDEGIRFIGEWKPKNSGDSYLIGVCTL
ncbi:ORF6C domain-containing protein [Paenibacillus wynnii]|uniref:ORF6C domain-containing protein n=1 Tax=Paenibacillus wynnii TaxID=268407 RepID=A0A098MF64_9BACL|nr:ORF6C domain-containing protein [Paenibacillus wynnii]KGE20678.1 hypothetical protein PWYN_00305 [Paenibacillus wynnii]